MKILSKSVKRLKSYSQNKYLDQVGRHFVLMENIFHTNFIQAIYKLQQFLWKFYKNRWSRWKDIAETSI
jgi:hypothetical protein